MSTRTLGRLGSALPTLLLLGCTAVPLAPGQAVAQEMGEDSGSPVAEPATAPAIEFAPPPGTREDSALMFEIMIAELAGRRGRLDIALEGYASAAARSTDPRVAERAARLAIFARDWNAADIAIERWSELAPEQREPLELHAQVLIRRGEPAAAADRFIALIDGSDGPRELALGAVMLLLQADPDTGTARAVAASLAERYPDDGATQLALARLALAEGDIDGAAVALERALTVAPDEPETILMQARLQSLQGDVDAAVATLSAAIARNPDSAELALGEVQLLLESGRTEAASAALDTLGERADLDGDTLLSIGLVALEIDRPEAAERFFIRLLASGEHTDRARFQLARLSDLAGDSASAIEGYQSVTADELFLPARLRLAELLADEGRLDEALTGLRALRRAVQDPMLQPRLLTTEARLLQRAGEDEAAIELLSDALAEYPGSSELLYARALTAGDVGQDEMLEQDLGRLIEAEPDNAHALNALGYHLVLRNERLDEAAGYLERASSLLPEDPAIMDSLGWLHFHQGDLEAALTLLERALELLPDPEIAAHLGEVLWTLERREEARAVWDDALTRDPDHEKLNRTIERLAP